ncbi:MAG: hypothetical protein GY703_13460 [Gammaproteobacteria bacterium]|nr:hypothetical protein [Gammaproteobacteria bacterium]
MYAPAQLTNPQAWGQGAGSIQTPAAPPTQQSNTDTATIKSAITNAIEAALQPWQQRLTEIEENIVATSASMHASLDPIQQRMSVIENTIASGAAQGGAKKKAASVKEPPSTADRTLTKELKKMGLANKRATEESDTDWDTSTTTSDSDTSPAKPTAQKKKKGGKGNKLLGRDMLAHNCKEATVAWPHHKVFNGKGMRGSPYDSLTKSQFFYGVLKQIRNPKYESDLFAMLTI